MIDTWMFFAGLGLFLYGMTQMENVLKQLSGRSFKLFIRKYTQNLFKAIAGGALITGLVQSSSVVSLLVLAFVEAGVISFRNALGVILGSNLGTTFDSWIVASIGFKLDIEGYALPTIGITAISMFFLSKNEKVHNYLRLFFSLGILFLGLAYMKQGAEQLVHSFDLAQFSQYGSWFFVIIGFLITTLIQSSSATIAITLTALHAGILSFTPALAIVIGSELGTTIKIIFSGLRGTADKKRAAWGNFIFNLVTMIGAFLLLPWLTIFIQKIVRIHDPLYGLVFFQTLINLLGILVFVPLIGIISKWLQQSFKNHDDASPSYIGKDLPVMPILAVDTMLREAENLFNKALKFHEHVLGLKRHKHEGGLIQGVKSAIHGSETSATLYDKLKQTEGDILEYFMKLQTSDLNKIQYHHIDRYIAGVRHIIHAAKSIKDIDHNITSFKNAVNDTIHDHYQTLQENWIAFSQSLQNEMSLIDSYEAAVRKAYEGYEERQQLFMRQLEQRALNEKDVSTLLNVEQELLSSKKSLIRALASLHLSPPVSNEFEFYP